MDSLLREPCSSLSPHRQLVWQARSHPFHNGSMLHLRSFLASRSESASNKPSAGTKSLSLQESSGSFGSRVSGCGCRVCLWRHLNLRLACRWSAARIFGRREAIRRSKRGEISTFGIYLIHPLVDSLLEQALLKPFDVEMTPVPRIPLVHVYRWRPHTGSERPGFGASANAIGSPTVRRSARRPRHRQRSRPWLPMVTRVLYVRIRQGPQIGYARF